MQPLSTRRYVIRRLIDDWKLLLSIFLGITIATTLITGAPVYIQALERQGINTAIDRAPGSLLDIFIFARNVPLDADSLEGADRLIDEGVERHLSEVVRGRERYLRGPTYLVGLPRQPIVDGRRVSRGYFQSLSNLEHHVTFVQGRMATDEVLPGPRGPIVEVVLGAPTASVFGVAVGEVVTLTPSLNNRTRVQARIVGILEPTDPTDEYWQHNSSIFVDPGPLPEGPDIGVEVDPEEPPLAAFVTLGAFVEGVGRAYPGTLITSTWMIFVDKDGLKSWSTSKSVSRVNALEGDLVSGLPGVAVFTGIKALVADYNERSFFSRVPLVLLMSIMVITVLYYLGMMVSYLVQSRESDVALLRSRGASTRQLLRLYALEGLVLTAVAAVVAPFLAMGAVAAAGKLPYFRDITGGDFLPVELRWMPFLVAIGAGLLSLAIFVVPGVVGARAGLVIHKLRSSRPLSVPFFQRYYLDVGLLVLGGLVFWELRARGELVSGGLFQDVKVNEALLLAPVLLLTVVALLFMRFFPLFVRFISGESPALLHLAVAATLGALAPSIVARELGDDSGLASVAPLVLLAALAGIYWATNRAQGLQPRLWGLASQAGVVAFVVMLQPPATDEISFVPTIAFILIVPAQILYILFRWLAQIAPVWVSMGLWHMARNPMQYSWLVLLLVMVTGLGVLSTTVGGTLDRSQRERILYDTVADIRVTGTPGFFNRGNRDLKELYLTIPGVTAVSMALRGEGTVGTSYFGSQFETLAVESQDFQYISWYRDDFSTRPLSGVMRALHVGTRSQPLAIPEGAEEIGVWIKPLDAYPNVFLWMVLKDARDVAHTVTLGGLGAPDWHRMSAEIPAHLEPPLELVSVQLYEPVFGPGGTPLVLLLDDIHVPNGREGEVDVLDGFEDRNEWSPLATSMISSDSIALTAKDVYRGERAAVFSVGKDTDRGIRGFYRSPSGRPVPIVASSSFITRTGHQVGDALIIEMMGRLVPVVIRDSVDYFPTMDPGGGGFIVTDLDGLLDHLNLISPIARFAPNEIFITEAPGAAQSVRDVVATLAASTTGVHDREALLASVRLDPLITAGWRAMVPLSLAIILVSASLGYVTYLLSYANRSRSEMGFLQSLGLSGRQALGLLSLEHIVILIVGLGLGTWAGFQMSALMVSSVEVTETGDKVIPPFILMTDWSYMLPIYAALVGIFVAALYWLKRSMLRVDLQAVSRVEGQ